MESRSGLVGSWRIDHSELWDREALDLVGPASLEITEDGNGVMRFIAVEVFLDCRFVDRDGKPSVEFSFDGEDEMDPISGRGWASIDSDGTLTGRLFIHRGDDSGFAASRVSST